MCECYLYAHKHCRLCYKGMHYCKDYEVIKRRNLGREREVEIYFGKAI